MSDQGETFEAPDWQGGPASVNRLRVENWLKIAKVLRWSPLFRATLPVRIILALTSGIVCGIWLDGKHFETSGPSPWLVASALFVAILALLSIGKGALSRWIQKMTAEIGAAPGTQVTAREAMAFASEALTYCHGHSSVPAGTTLENFRRTCRRLRLGGSRNPVWGLALGIQMVVLASFALGGLLLKLAPPSSQIAKPSVIQPMPISTAEPSLQTPLKEMAVEESPVPTLPPTVAKTGPQAVTPQADWETPEEIQRLARELVQLENKGELEPLLALYGSKVNYFGTPRDNGEIRREKEADFKKWVKRNYQITSEPKISAVGDGKWQATFDQTFECENTAGEISTGRIASALVFERVDGGLRITSQVGPVSGHKTIAKIQPTATPSVQPPDQVPEESSPPAPEETSPPVPEESSPPVREEWDDPHSRLIYKVPALKNLVNGRMDNKWLYGEFCLIRWKGNIAYCSTFARGLRLRERGPTRLEIEFSGGLHLTSAVSRDLDKNRLLTFTISQANPIQLLSVTKDHTGRIHVRGRTQRRLSEEDLHAH